METNYDLIVIGAGPAGYVAAIRAAQLGLKVACIDEMQHQGKPALGGTCLNVGCIPSKALLESSEAYAQAKSGLDKHGISVENPSIDISAMQARKDKVVAGLTGGIAQLFKANGVTPIFGHGRVLADKSVTVTDPKTGKILESLSVPHVILATGSTPMALPNLPFDHQTILNSDDLLALEVVPEKMVIVGAGVIGLELGSVWNHLGAEVILLEAMDEFLPTADRQVARQAQQAFKKQGLDIRLGAMVKGIETHKKGATISYEQKGEQDQIEADKVAIMIGRKPNTDNLLASDSGIATDQRGFIQVDSRCRTEIEGIWAIGDVVRGPMLAHKGSEEGVMVVELIAGKNPQTVDLDTIPSVIYTHPEIAWVGKTEAALKDEGVAFKVGSFPFAASGRAQASADTTGMIKVIADAETDRILGVHMIGSKVSELLAEAGFAINYQATAEDVGSTVHAHPTLSEAMKEAALAVHKEAIHKVG